MENRNLFRFSALAAILSSGLSYLAVLVSIVALFVPGIPDLVVAGLILATDPFVLVALIGVYGIQAKEIGGLGLIGFVLTVLALPFTILLAPLGFPVFLVGVLLLAIATARARVLPAGGMWLWFIGAMVAMPAGFLGLGILFVLGLALAACGRAWLGITLWSASPLRQDTVCP